MKKATITYLKNNLSAVLDQVRNGATVVVTDRNRPVARLVPVVDQVDPEGRVERLERAGLIRRGARLAAELMRRPPRLERKVDAVALLIDERNASR